MFPRSRWSLCHVVAWLMALPTTLFAQKPPYDVFPPAEPPYYRVRYEASTKPGELIYPGQLHDLDSAGREDAARRHRASARLRRRVVQVGPDRCLRSALASAGEEARLCLAGSVLRATRKSRLPDVVRSAKRLRRGVPEVSGRSRREVRAIPSWRRCRGRCGDIAAAVTGPAGWCCCIRTALPRPGCVRACRC